MFRKDPLLVAVLWWTAIVAFVIVWLPLVRGATQGDAYPWALTDGIGGRGVGGDYWMVLLGAAFVLSLLYLGWRGGRPPFHALVLAFHVPLAAAVVYTAWTNPRSLRFEGATAGISLPLEILGPVLFGGFALAAIAWVVRDLNARRSRETRTLIWTRAARVRLALVVALIPFEVVLFRSGGLESTPNVIGIFLVGWQWAMVNRILAGGRPHTVSRGFRAMDKQEAMDLMAEELRTWRDKTYAELSSRVGESHRFEKTGPSGTRYQGKVEMFFDDHPGEDVRVMASIDDGGWRSSLSPLSDSFILSKTGKFVGE